MSSKWIKNAIPLIVLLGIWELISLSWGDKNFPNPYHVLKFANSSLFFDAKISAQNIGEHGFSSHILETLGFFVSGYLLGSLLSIFFSLLMYFNSRIRNWMSPVFVLSGIIPPLILIPILLAFIKGIWAKLIIVSVYTCLANTVFFLTSLDNINVAFIQLSEILKISTRRRIFDVLLPAIKPSIVGGMKISLAASLGVLILIESIGAFNGIGKILSATTTFNDVGYAVVSIFWAFLMVLLIENALKRLLDRMYG